LCKKGGYQEKKKKKKQGNQSKKIRRRDSQRTPLQTGEKAYRKIKEDKHTGKKKEGSRKDT